MRAWLRTAGELPCNVKVLVEGEEEIGSPGLAGFLDAHVDDLRSDVLLLADAGNWSVGTPGLTYSLRGLAGVDVRVRALDGPVHSGMAGGAVPDPVLALGAAARHPRRRARRSRVRRLLGRLRAARRRRARPHSPRSRRTEVGLRRAWGVRDGVELAGDPSISIFERLWLRPTVTVIGIDGHPIAGSSNQIVAEAAARVSVRVGRGQDPARLNAALRAHLERRDPARPRAHDHRARRGAGVALRTRRAGRSTPPSARCVPASASTRCTWASAGSIPFVGPFADAFGGIPALLLGPADPGSRIHGEDESLHLGDWHKLIESEVHLLAELAKPTERS